MNMKEIVGENDKVRWYEQQNLIQNYMMIKEKMSNCDNQNMVKSEFKFNLFTLSVNKIKCELRFTAFTKL